MDLEQLEALAFAEDRDAALAQLLPGSADHDYYRCVHLQQRGKLEEAQKIIDEWSNRHSDGRHEILEMRQLLLRLSKRGERQDRDDLRDAFGAHHWHEPEEAPGATRLPSALDRHAIDGAALLREAVRYSSDLSQVTEEGLYELLVSSDERYDLDEARRRKLLDRVSHSPSPRLVERIAADLGPRELARFGTVSAHRTLTLAQLSELARLRRELATHKEWVNMVVQRLRPQAHVPYEKHGAARLRYLTELWSFVSQLVETFTSLKLHVLWHLLDEGRRQQPAVHDRALFLAYLKLPRHASFLHEQYHKRAQSELGQLGADFRAQTGLLPAGDDEALVRDYLYALLVDTSGGADDSKDLEALLERTWFERELATIRLLGGAPEAEKWTRVLGPARAQALHERVEIELSPDNPEEVGEDDALALAFNVKNVAQLFVKVFRIDPVTYFAIHGREVGADIDLDGLAASHEEVLAFAEPAIRRVRRTLALPQCQRAGCYVIDLIGNGKSSRALIWKGRLRMVRRVTASGQVVTVFDQAGKVRPAARMWMGGRELLPDADGLIAVPFTSARNPGGTSQVLLVDGDLATVTSLPQVQEQYELRLAAHVEREAMSANRTARAVVRVTLFVAGVPAPLALLQEPVWELVLTDRFGATTQKIQPLVLDDDSDVALEWAMPDDVGLVALRVRGKVEVLTEQKPLELSAELQAELGQMHQGPYTDALYLAQTDRGYVLSALGKSGEAKSRQRVPFWFTHRFSRTQQTASLDTDERGRIELGPLDGVSSLQAMGNGMQFGWQLVSRGAGAALHVMEGETVRMAPPLGYTAEELLAMASLVELRAGVPNQHANAALFVDGRNLVIRGLAAGEYQLRIPAMDVWQLTVLPAQAARVDEHAATELESYRLLPAPAVIDHVEVGDQELTIAVKGARAGTRIHVVATRFVPSPGMGTLESSRRRGGKTRDVHKGTHYQSGRDLGDEYRYVLDRRQAARRPGMMADKPSLLLNPWARKATTTAVARPMAGGAYGAAAAMRPQMVGEIGGGGGGAAQQGQSFAAFDFVPGDAVLVPNLRPDREGLVRVARAQLGEASSVQVICADAEQTSSVRVCLPERALAPRDRRLMRALPADAHITQRRQIDPCKAGETVTIQDAATAKVHIVDTLERAHAYLLSLGGDDTLREFAFVTRWHKLGEAERGELYSKYACHELNLFLYFRDRPYFNRVITPYLAQKRVQTFVDRWLLGGDLSGYLEPRELGRLHAVEKALLALRLPRRDELARILADEVALLPPDPEREAHIVEVMLAGAALDDDDSGLQAHARESIDKLDYGEMDELSESTSQLAAVTPMMEMSPSSMSMQKAPAPMAPMAAADAARGGMARGAPPPPAMSAPPPAPKRARQIAAEDSFDDEGGYERMEKKKEKGGDVRRRAELKPMFRPADKTQEWAEQNWWRRYPGDAGAEMVAVNRFWRDLAMHRDGPFLSGALGLATGSFAEAMCALAVLDLPFEAPAHRIDNDGATLTITTSCNALVASSQLVAAELTGGLPLIVGQSYLRNDDRHHFIEGEYVQKFVTGPLIAGVIYATQVVVANPTGTHQRVSVLVQIPRGSVAANAARATRTYDVSLQPYAAHGIEVCFYFPKAGTTSHFGAHVSKRGALIAAAPGATLQVVDASDAVDVTSWGHISQRGSLEAVLKILREENLGSIDLSSIAWRMRDEAAYQQILEVLEQRLAFDPVLWSYALWHGDRARTRRWLRTHDRLASAGPVIDAALVELDAEQMETYEHLELAPLINARAHRLGAKTKILNDGFSKQLTSFLELVAHRKAPTVDDLLVLAHYLFAQDRFDEARAAMERAEAADAAGHRSRMQLDYLRAYAACSAGDLEAARALARRWLDQPVDRWRKKFAAMMALLDEAVGASAGTAADRGAAGEAPVDGRSREQLQASLARAQPSFELSVDAGGVELVAQRIGAIELRYFAMDIELLFSRQPFVQADVSRFSYIEPGFRQVVELGDGLAPVRVAWPESMRGQNVVVEAVGAGLRKAKVHYAHDLAVVTAHQYGQVRVQRASTRTPAVAAYVKVYARRGDGEVAFYKDGYTDVRGWFDYASLSTDELDHAERFAILVHADALGATIVESDPPPR